MWQAGCRGDPAVSHDKISQGLISDGMPLNVPPDKELRL